MCALVEKGYIYRTDNTNSFSQNIVFFSLFVRSYTKAYNVQCKQVFGFDVWTKKKIFHVGDRQKFQKNKIKSKIGN